MQSLSHSRQATLGRLVTVYDDGLRFLPDGVGKVNKRPGGRPNGLALDGDGNMWIAEPGFRAFNRVTVEDRANSSVSTRTATCG